MQLLSGTKRIGIKKQLKPNILRPKSVDFDVTQIWSFVFGKVCEGENICKTYLYSKKILITGAAGFIGANLSMKLLNSAIPMHIVDMDNCNDYYDPVIKDYRLQEIQKVADKNRQSTWKFVRRDIADKVLVDKLFDTYHFNIVVNLAVQAGVRYSITNLDAYN